MTKNTINTILERTESGDLYDVSRSSQSPSYRELLRTFNWTSAVIDALDPSIRRGTASLATKVAIVSLAADTIKKAEEDNPAYAGELTKAVAAYFVALRKEDPKQVEDICDILRYLDAHQ